MPKKRERLSGMETELLKLLWDEEPVSVSALTKCYNASRSDSPIKRGTVHVVLGRLEEKGWVKRREEGRGFLYVATVAREKGLAQLVGDFQKKLFGGSPLGLVQCLVKGQGLKRSEIDQMRAMLDRAEVALESEKEKGKTS